MTTTAGAPPGADPARARIRPYATPDLAAVYDVCVRTGAAGGDARGRHGSDDLLPDVFAGPYVVLEPELAFVLDDGERAVGYVVGTADTAAFVRAYRTRWLPQVADRYPVPQVPPRTPDDRLTALLLRPERMLVPELAAYPAHLHVDVLPEHQGGGHGRALVETFLRAARAAGAGAVHLGVDPANTRALGFYERTGFHRIEVPDAVGVLYLGRSTALEEPAGGGGGTRG
ncbi:GNAT family N-acetyltransferase [Kineococcus glutinatus]|uniref:N-acetyltransferase n=1 Tax=Kineococcus glutinatus TaxID=1070872 RepID=A0ABP8VDT6_9ACTN